MNFSQIFCVKLSKVSVKVSKLRKGPCFQELIWLGSRSFKKIRRDSGFRNRILTAYKQKCAMCGIQLRLIEAAHIVPVSYDTSTDETQNGMSLCSLHHKAYDNGLITIKPDYTIIENDKIISDFKQHDLIGGLETFRENLRNIIHLPPDERDRPDKDYIRLGNKIRGWEVE